MRTHFTAAIVLMATLVAVAIPATATETPVVDILVVYHPDYPVVSGKIETQIVENVLEGAQRLSTALANSHAQAQVRLVGIAKASSDWYDGATREATLEWLVVEGTRSDSPVSKLRAQYGADVMYYIGTAPGDLANGPGSAEDLDPSHGFAVGPISSLEHGVGHLLGLGHFSWAPHGFPVGKGWCDGTENTVMIGPEDIAVCGASSKRVLYFSNPEVGMGDEEHNAVAVINETAPYVAEYATPPVVHPAALATVDTGNTSLCIANFSTLCLSAGRFEVQADWQTSKGDIGFGTAVALTPDTGYFWFFDSGNVEMVVKVLNACSFAKHIWVFAGGLTNVQVVLRVRDTQTGELNYYVNPQGSAFQPIQDTQAFATCP